MTAIVVIEAVVILLLVVLMAGLLKSHAEILRKLDRLGAGGELVPHRAATGGPGLGPTPVEAVVGTDLAGAARSIGLVDVPEPTLLAFLSSGCASCHTFWSELRAGATLLDNTRLVAVTKGTRSESAPKLLELADSTLPVVMSDDAWDAFEVPMTPYFVLVAADGSLSGTGSATTVDQLRDLMQRAVIEADPARLDTGGRERFTDDALGRTGVEPGDPSLYENPADG